MLPSLKIVYDISVWTRIFPVPLSSSRRQIVVVDIFIGRRSSHGYASVDHVAASVAALVQILCTPAILAAVAPPSADIAVH